MSTHKYLRGQCVKLPLRLVEKLVLTRDAYMYTFGFPCHDAILGIPVGGCVQLYARINGEDVTRPYTPITLDELKGCFKIVVKTYRKGVNPEFPNGGKMSQYLETLSVGDGIDVSGPFGYIHYLGDGNFEIERANARKLKANYINMICGGSGIAPMYQMLKYIFNSCTDKTKIALISSNQTEKDIILRDELEKLRDANQTQFRLWYNLTSPPENWSYSGGHIDQGIIDEHCYPAGVNTVNLLCGPDAMIQDACIPALMALGHTDENILTF